MTYDHAVHMAVEALQDRIRALAVDANLHDLYHANHPAAITASQKRVEIREAIKALIDGVLGNCPPFVAGDWSGYEVCTICGGLVRYDLRESHFMECQAAFLDQEIPATPA